MTRGRTTLRLVSSHGAPVIGPSREPRPPTLFDALGLREHATPSIHDPMTWPLGVALALRADGPVTDPNGQPVDPWPGAPLPTLGYLIAGGGACVFVGAIDREQAPVRALEYSSFDAVIRGGWRVD
ncbi:MAG: hypothetical protein ACREU5_06980 [Burkholderiales bacterium]